MFLGAAEFEDVVLRDAEVFEEHPGRVREIFGLGSAQFRRQIFDGVVEGGVGLAAGEECEEVLAELGVRVLGMRASGGIGCS